jgi:hypothetical protein
MERYQDRLPKDHDALYQQAIQIIRPTGPSIKTRKQTSRSRKKARTNENNPVHVCTLLFSFGFAQVHTCTSLFSFDFAQVPSGIPFSYE